MKVRLNGLKVWIIVSIMVALCITTGAMAIETQSAIVGSSYLDANSNGTLDGDEMKITGVPVDLYRIQDNKETLQAETLTDDYGEYRFDALEAGQYRIHSRINAPLYYIQNIEKTVVDLMPATTVTSDIILGTATGMHISLFEDMNGNGEKNKYDAPLKDVTLQLIDAFGNQLSATTDKDGVAIFENVDPNNNAIQLSIQKGFSITNGENDAVTSVENGIAKITTQSSNSAGKIEIVIGACKAGSMSGKVFEDVNNNGIMDEDEPGIEGIVLHITGQNSHLDYSRSSDSNGLYVFDGLPNDKYIITIDLPEDKLFARYSATGGDLRSIFSGAIMERDFRVNNASNLDNLNVGLIENGIIQGNAFFDINYNGILDNDEPGYKDISFIATRVASDEIQPRVTSDESGIASVEGLRSGEYELRVVLPSDGSVFTILPENSSNEKANMVRMVGAVRENTLRDIVINSGEKKDIYVGIALGGSVSGVVFEDANFDGIKQGSEKAISGIEVQLRDQAGTILDTVRTAPNGHYEITGIMPGDYSLAFSRKYNHGFTRLRADENNGNDVIEMVDGYGITGDFPIKMAEEITNINAGQLRSGTVSGQLFHDKNDNGLWDELEPGMSNATVSLTSTDGEISLTTTVNEKGDYFFDGVMPCDYVLKFNLPPHASMAKTLNNGNTFDSIESKVFSIKMGADSVIQLAGALDLGSFEGIVYLDHNGNGIKDDGENALSGTKITINDVKASNGDGEGRFKIIDLRPGDYELEITLPNELIFSNIPENFGLNLDTLNTQKLPVSWEILTSRNDYSIGAVLPASISGELWLDEDKSGSRTSEEALLIGVPIALRDAKTDALLKQSHTSETGFVFENVRPGTYHISFDFPNQSTASKDTTTTFKPNTYGMRHENIAVAEGEAINGLHVGLVSTTSLGGQMILHKGTETQGVEGIQVQLFNSYDSTALATTFTNETGHYQFDGLWPSDYIIRADIPKGMVFVKQDDENFAETPSIIHGVVDGTGVSVPIKVEMAQHQSQANMHLILPAIIGDNAWLDTNKNGLIDSGEAGIAGIQISLLQNDEVVYQTETDAFGYYVFEDVYPGTYTLNANAYEAFELTKQIPALAIISNALETGDGLQATINALTVASGETNLNINLGYILKDGAQLPSEMVPPPAKNWLRTQPVEEK